MSIAVCVWLSASLAASLWIAGRAWQNYREDRAVVNAMLARRGLCRRVAEEDWEAMERMARIDAERAEWLGREYARRDGE